MKYTICDHCERKVYQGSFAYIHASCHLYCSEECLFEAVDIEEFTVDDENCEMEDDEEDDETGWATGTELTDGQDAWLEEERL